MRSNRAIQTLILAVMLILVTAIAYRLNRPVSGMPQDGGVAAPSGAPEPDPKGLARAYREYFEEDPELRAKAELLSIETKDFSVDGTLAHVKLNIEFKWVGHNPAFTVGPLKNAPGKRGDTLRYTEIFPYRYWTKSRKWDIEGRREREEYR